MRGKANVLPISLDLFLVLYTLQENAEADIHQDIDEKWPRTCIFLEAHTDSFQSATF